MLINHAEYAVAYAIRSTRNDGIPIVVSQSTWRTIVAFILPAYKTQEFA